MYIYNHQLLLVNQKCIYIYFSSCTLTGYTSSAVTVNSILSQFVNQQHVHQLQRMIQNITEITASNPPSQQVHWDEGYADHYTSPSCGTFGMGSNWAVPTWNGLIMDSYLMALLFLSSCSQ